MDSADPAFRCTLCPKHARCKGGTPPVFDVVEMQMVVAVDGVTQSELDTHAEVLQRALAKQLDILPSAVHLRARVPARRVGSAKLEVVVEVTRTEAEEVVAGRGGIAEAVVAALQAAGSLDSATVRVEAELRERGGKDKWEVGQDGRFYLKQCRAGTLLVNTTADLQVDVLCARARSMHLS